jgi:hypothetical protein
MDMKKAFGLLVASLLLSPLAAEAVPGTLPFAARIADNGRPVSGNHDFTFRFYDGPDVTVATLLWEEAKPGLAVTDGVVATALGDVTPINALTIFNGLPVYLQVVVDGTAFPVVAIQSVPYALRAGIADTLAGFEAPQTRLLTVPAGACTYPPSVTSAALIKSPFYCDLSDGTTNFTGVLPVQLPPNAVVRGLQIWAFASGTVTCNLLRGLDNFGVPVASVSKSGVGWALSPETLVTHAVDNNQAYALQCSGTGVASDNVVGTIKIRYTLATP